MNRTACLARVRSGAIALAPACWLALAIGCSGASSPLDISCSDFLDLPRDDQLEVAAEWTDENSLVSSDIAGVTVGSRGQLVGHCEDNPDDRISELRTRFPNN